MDDIDFLSEGREEDKKKDEGKKAPEEDMTMHVPEVPEEPAENGGGGSLSDAASEKEEAGDEENTSPEPPKTETPPPPKPPKERKVAKPAPGPEDAPPPEPPSPPSPPKPPKPSEKDHEPERNAGGDTLRVSLLATEEGGGLTDMTVRRRVRTFLIVLVLALILDGLIYGGILFYESRVQQKIETIEAGVEDLDANIAAAEERAVPARNYQRLTRLAEDLVASHAHWTNLLALMEDLTAKQVRFMNLSGAETGTVTANIVAKDYTTIARQLVALRESPMIKSAKIGSVSADFGEEGLVQGARTTLTVVVDESVFLASVNEENDEE